jgi:class 3 adenylate cyclase
MRDGHYQETRIAVAFGDIAGFTDAYEQATSPLKEFSPFFDRFDSMLTRVGRATGFPFDDTGDGFMCVMDLPNGHACGRVAEMLSALHDLNAGINREIAEMEGAARFRFFRIRVAAGYVLRKVNANGKVVYRGKPINLAHKALQFVKDERLVAHGSFRALITDRQLANAGFEAERMRPPRRRPEGISAEAAQRMYAIRPLKGAR